MMHKINYLVASGIFGMVVTPDALAQVTLINTFEVPEQRLDETIHAWEVARDFLSTQPGFIETALHRSRDENAKYQIINIAIWNSEADFFTATSKMRSEKVMPLVDGLKFQPALYDVIRHDFAEPERSE
ncbi:MAG: antibiotic biosynthesis monooxygenase family protein [Pseudomonadota bacterium]